VLTSLGFAAANVNQFACLYFQRLRQIWADAAKDRLLFQPDWYLPRYSAVRGYSRPN
jgi:hypothetical protein